MQPLQGETRIVWVDQHPLLPAAATVETQFDCKGRRILFIAQNIHTRCKYATARLPLKITLILLLFLQSAVIFTDELADFVGHPQELLP